MLVMLRSEHSAMASAPVRPRGWAVVTRHAAAGALQCTRPTKCALQGLRGGVQGSGWVMATYGHTLVIMTNRPCAPPAGTSPWSFGLQTWLQLGHDSSDSLFSHHDKHSHLPAGTSRSSSGRAPRTSTTPPPTRTSLPSSFPSPPWCRMLVGTAAAGRLGSSSIASTHSAVPLLRLGGAPRQWVVLVAAAVRCVQTA